MQIFELSRDIGLSYDGDLIIDSSQDLEIISGQEWFLRDVNKIIKTVLGEWKSEPEIGVNLESVIGQSNTRETAAEIKTKLMEALNLDNFAFPGSFDIKVIPIDYDSFSIYITYNIIGDVLSIGKLIFDLSRGLSSPIYDELENKEQLPATHRKETGNKYLKSLIHR